MVDIKFEILTSWVGDGTGGNANRPKLGDDHILLKWEDTTGQNAQILPPSPNLYIILAKATQVNYDAIVADPNYGDEAILWSEEIDVQE